MNPPPIRNFSGIMDKEGSNFSAELTPLVRPFANTTFDPLASSSNMTEMALHMNGDSLKDSDSQRSPTLQDDTLGSARYGTLGQLSYAPATQTTVVTTTTTTTTSFPPLIIKAPRDLQSRDPKLYPLAGTPTPPALKRFCFDLEGKPTWFREAEDPQESVAEIQQQQSLLRSNNGFVRRTTRVEPHFETPPSYKGSVYTNRVVDPNKTSSRKRLASPVSLSDVAARLRSQQEQELQRSLTRSSSATKLSRNSSFDFDLGRLTSAEVSGPKVTTPTTPGAASTVPERPSRSHVRRSSALSHLRRRAEHITTTQQETPVSLSPIPSTSKTVETKEEESAESVPQELHAEPRSSTADVTKTEDEDFVMVESGPEAPVTPSEGAGLASSTTGSGPILAPIDTTVAALSANLPSPSLSPVTAALSNANESGFGSPSSSEDLDSSFDQSPSQQESDGIEYEGPALASALLQRRIASRQRSSYLSSADSTHSGPSLMDLPTMVDSFDALPSEMKNYLMYQFLRRCPKGTLQMVAGVVNPALRCDFLDLLPLELSLNIIGNLDVKSLCAAAQVSKKWRSIVNSAEAVWKNLFDRDEYVLGEGELQKAIQEGWGWQDPSGNGDWEKDISMLSQTRQSPSSDPFSSPETLTSDSPVSSRPKRKAAPTFNSVSRRRSKRSKELVAKTRTEAGQDSWEHERPYTAAEIAVRAVVDPVLPSVPTEFQQHHLFKSIYRKHHIMRKMWTDPNVKPKHLSFRAHSGHVVTCLQFDEDKVLTGSDDANINVYEANTGILRRTLVGHEGGVWALQYVGNTLVSGSTDRTVRVWDIESGRCMHVFEGHTSTVRCLQILMPSCIGKDANGDDIMMPAEPLIITGSRDSTLRIWKLPNLRDKNGSLVHPRPTHEYNVRTLSGHMQSVRAIAAHGDTLVSGSYDTTVRVWKISTGDTVHRLAGHAMKVYSIVLDHERNRCISGSMDNMVKIWSLESGTCLYTLEGHSSLVGLLDLRSDLLVSAAADSTLRIWNPENGQCQHVLSAHTAAITCFQHDGYKVISGSDKTLKMWDAKSGEFVRDLLENLTGGWQIRFNERKCVAAVQRNQMTFIEVLDFGAARYGEPAENLGRRIVVDEQGNEIPDPALAVEAPELPHHLHHLNVQHAPPAAGAAAAPGAAAGAAAPET
jgi:F-box and WD-40 domain protein CDC4